MEHQFLSLYPEGFESPELVEGTKKHKMDKMTHFVQEAFSLEGLRHTKEAIKNIKKLISSASIVSVFEKTAFRNLLNESDDLFEVELVDAIREMIHHDQAQGFERIVSLLAPYKLAKWPILSAMLLYYAPNEEVLIKPTTVKKVISYFEIEGLHYSPKVNYDFYQQYRDTINQMKQLVDPKLSITNGHFSGFLMMSL
jgi:hypothetical protein